MGAGVGSNVFKAPFMIAQLMPREGRFPDLKDSSLLIDKA